MIRPFTVVCMLMAVGSGLYLYQCKHQAQVLDREIARTIKQTEAARERIGMLRAEWAQLNEPERVSELARAHSGLQTARPAQFIAVADLSGKLPAALAATRPIQPADLAEDRETAAPVVVAEPPAPRPAAESRPVARAPSPPEPRPTQTAASMRPAAAAPPEPRPMQTAAQMPPPAAAEPKPVRHVAPPAPAPAPVAPAPVAPVPAPVQAAALHPAPRPVPPARPAWAPTSADAVAPGTIGAAVLRAMRSRDSTPPVHEAAPAVAPAVLSRPAAAPVAMPALPAAQAYAAPVSGSLLGGRTSALPPPVPFAAR